jgi:transcriptional regulator with XRE-family HTH domain
VDKRKRFAINLQETREARELSQEELGYRCGLHRTAISLLERGRREPRLGTIVKLAAALETTPEALFAGIRWLPTQERFEVETPDGRRHGAG